MKESKQGHSKILFFFDYIPENLDHSVADSTLGGFFSAHIPIRNIWMQRRQWKKRSELFREWVEAQRVWLERESCVRSSLPSIVSSYRISVAFFNQKCKATEIIAMSSKLVKLVCVPVRNRNRCKADGPAERASLFEYHRISVVLLHSSARPMDLT